MTEKRFVTLGDGRKVGLGTYVAAWKSCLALPPKTHIGRGVSGWGQTAAEALSDLREGMHDRINRHVPGYGAGRKWDSDWQRVAWSAARLVNSRAVIRENETRWLPPEFRARLAHRMEAA